MALNGTLTANGYGSIGVRITGIAWGLNIIASEDHAAYTKAFYCRQVQTDTFSLQVQFVSSTERHAFYEWALGYSNQATTPDNTVGMIQADCQGTYYPDGQPYLPPFSMIGVMTAGVTESTQNKDVTWSMSLGFSGAQFTSGASFVSDFNVVSVPSGGTEQAQYFYPTSSALASTSPDSLYASAQSYLHPAPKKSSLLNRTVGLPGRPTNI